MQCQDCGERPASIHLTQIVDDSVTTLHLCEQCAEKKGVQTTAAVAKYQELRARHPEDYDFGEPQLNRLGYELLNSGQGNTAVAMFQLNTQTYPESANCYDRLGEVIVGVRRGERAEINTRTT